MIGAGITGLTAALQLVRRGVPQVVLIEAEPRLGGKIRTHRFQGLPVEAGPDSFLTRQPEALGLVVELGLANRLVAPSRAPAYLLMDGRLLRFPEGLLMGMPVRPEALDGTEILTEAGIERARRLEPVPVPIADQSVWAFASSRYGEEVAQRLVDPLLSGVYAGRSEALSMAAVLPGVWESARAGRQLTAPPAGAGEAPAFMTIDSGLGRLVDAVATTLRGSHRVEIRIGRPVTRLEPGGGGFQLETGDGSTLEVQAVVLATPAPEAARLLQGWAAEAARLLAGIEYASVATITLAYPEDAVPGGLAGTGFLTARSQPGILVGCTWLSSKWPHLRAPRQVLMRAFVGRAGDAGWTRLDDAELINRVHQELVVALDLRRRPLDAAVSRWPRSLPQYAVGHLDRLAEIDTRLASHPRLALAGAAYRGIGLPACIRQGRQAADRVAAAL